MATGEVPLSQFLEGQLREVEEALDNLGSAMRARDYQVLLDGVQAAAHMLDEWRQELEERLRQESRSKSWDGTAAERLEKLRTMIKGGIRPKLRTLLSIAGMAQAGRHGVTGSQLVNADFRKIGAEIVVAEDAVETEMEHIRDSLEEALDSVRDAPETERPPGGRESRASTARRAEVRLLLPPERDESA
ncbi:hypothetical protein OG828_48985 [Streptomyces sp. NBC_00457]|uniref:hypothetical protein n=1 Tax=Streptomyces sp. NBC_00457 TaxID=2975748 RepID=UPI002E24DE15